MTAWFFRIILKAHEMVNIYPLVRKCLSSPPLSLKSNSLFHASGSLYSKGVLLLKKAPGNFKKSLSIGISPIAMNPSVRYKKYLG